MPTNGRPPDRPPLEREFKRKSGCRTSIAGKTRLTIPPTDGQKKRSRLGEADRQQLDEVCRSSGLPADFCNGANYRRS